MLLLGSFFILHVLSDLMVGKNYLICLILYFHLDVFTYPCVMSDINMSIIFCFLGSILPNMRTKYSLGSCEDNMSASVMILQDLSAFDIDIGLYLCTFGVLDRLIEVMKDAFAYFIHVYDFVFRVVDGQGADIMKLTT